MSDGAIVELESVDALQGFVAEHAVAAVYFAGADCGVCQILEPRIRALLAERFPKVALARVATERAAELAAQYAVFAIPTLLFFFDGRESFRYARNFSIGEVERDIARPYGLYFE